MQNFQLPQSTETRRGRRYRRLMARIERRARRTSTRGPLAKPTVRPNEESLTRFAGLIPLIVYMTEVLRIPQLLKIALGPDEAARRVHALPLVLFGFVVGALGGVERMAHLEWLRDDMALLKYLRLGSWPVRKVFSAALAAVDDDGVAEVEQLVGDLGLSPLRGAKSVNLDIDNSAIVDHGTGEGSKFGYCGKGRRRRRHYPIVASVAESRAVVMAEYRDGSEMSAEDHIKFFGATIERVRRYVAEACRVRVRGDSGFWSPKLAGWLADNGVGFAFALPLYAGVKLMLMTATFAALTDDEDIEFARLKSEKLGLSCPGLTVVVVRRRVHDHRAPPQGKVIRWSPEWRYQAIISNEDWSAPDIWRFYNYRAECERVFRIGKQALGLGHLVGRGFRANRMAFLLRLLAYNADIRFQDYCEQRAREEARPVRHVGLEWRQIRFYLSPGRFVREAGRWVLRTPINQKLTELWAFYAPDLLSFEEEAE